MLKRGGADFVVMLALIDSTWKFMLVWNGAALGSILLNEIYDLADIHFLQFIAYISASLSIRFQPFFSCDGAGIHTSRLLQSGLTSDIHFKIASIALAAICLTLGYPCS